MMLSELRQTEFLVEPLRSLVGESNWPAFQIIVTRGKRLGTLGDMRDLNARFLPAADAANDDNIDSGTAQTTGGGGRPSLVRRILSLLK